MNLEHETADPPSNLAPATDEVGDWSLLRGIIPPQDTIELGAVEIADFVAGSLGELTPAVIHKLGLLFGAVVYMSDEERERERQKVLEDLLLNKAAIIRLLRREFLEATVEDERERVADELYAWLQEDLKERLVSKAGGDPKATGVKVSTCNCVDILARLIYAEAAGENDGVMAAMGWVVINRVRDRKREFKHLGTCDDVITAPGAFTSVGEDLWNEAGNPGALKGPAKSAYDRARAIAASICAGTLPDPTGGSLIYYSPQNMTPPGSKPKWNFDLLEEIKIPGVTNGALKLYRYK